MAVMGFLRERMGKILAIGIGVALFAFVGEEAIRQGSSMFKDDRNEIGEVAGEKIAYDEFSKLMDQNTAQIKQQMGQQALTAQFTNYAQENTWNQEVSQKILSKETDRIGLVVSGDEAQSMVSGNNPDPQIAQAFTNGQTGQFDKAALNNFLTGLKTAKTDDPRYVSWNAFITQMVETKTGEKYISLISNGLYVNALDAKDEYESKNKLVNFKYVTLDYSSIPDSKVTLTDDDYQSYYDEHKSEYNNKEELRSIDYVSFNASPSKEDSAAIKDQVEKLVPAFKSSNNDSLFVQVNAETKAPFLYKKKGQLGDPKLDTVMFGAQKGFIYGPYLSAGSYKIAKLVDSRVGPDSVKARHILIDAKTIGLTKAIAQADSLKKLIEGGKSFADLAKMYSIDKTSAEKGGDLGTFGRGMMVPVFEDAAFNGKKGDIKIVTSQFGVHLLEILDQKGSSQVVKVAVVDKPITASATTQNAAYSKAQKFLGSLTKENFDAEVKQAGLSKKTANDLSGLGYSLPGMEGGRDVIKWAFKASKGDFSDQVYVVGDQYIIPVLTGIKPKGTLPLDAVKKQIEPAVRNHVKAKMLIDKMQGATSLDQLAQKVGSKVVPVQNVVLANPVIPGLSIEYTVVGTMFGSKPNKISKPLEGQHGVYVVEVDNFINPAALANAVREKQQIGQTLLQRSRSQIFEALKDKANIKDYRAKFL